MTQGEPEGEKVAPLGVEALRVFYMGVGILLALAASLAAMVGFYSWKMPARDFVAPKEFPSPGVFQHQAGERHKLVEDQRRRLDDAAVPIAKAMEMIAARGQSAFLPLPLETPPPSVATRQTPNAVAAPPGRAKVGHHKRGRSQVRTR